MYVHADQNLSLEKTEILKNALMTSQYAKLSNFPDTPLPPAVLKLCNQSVPQQPIPQHISITDLLSRQNRKVISVLGDGNCFFRALSMIIYGSQEEHDRVRRNIVEMMKQNPEIFIALLPPGRTIQQHIEVMKTSRVWATQVEVQAAVEVYGVPLYLFTQTPTRNSYHWLRYTPRTQAVPTIPETHLELAHPLSVHFDAVIDATTSKPSRVPPQLTGKTDVHPGVL